MSDDLVKQLREPAFGTETTERNLMNKAADRIEQLVATCEELEAKLAECEARLEKANRYNEALESLRPVWAQGWTDDSMAAQASGGAVSAIWKMLDAKNQTQAVAKLKTVLDTFAELKGEKGE